jgi:hypothetical protein
LRITARYESELHYSRNKVGLESIQINNLENCRDRKDAVIEDTARAKKRFGLVKQGDEVPRLFVNGLIVDLYVRWSTWR